MKVSLIVALACCVFQPLMASDLQREARLADEIVDSILDGDAEMLEADGHEFLSIYTEAEEAKGAVIIMHGRGFHPDWAEVVQPLRVDLVESGWSTLSIQMPVLQKTAKYFDYIDTFTEATPRIDSAIEFLRAQGFDRVVLLSHSCGAHMAMHYVREKGDANFDGFIGIGMGATDYKQPMRHPFPLDKISKPILDVYGEQDFPAVLRLSSVRQQQIKASGHAQSKQVKVAQADHYFSGQGDRLVEVVADWLDEAFQNK